MEPEQPKNTIEEKAIQQRRPVFDPTGRVEGLTDDETLVFDVRRHPFGLILLIIQTVFAIILSLVLIVVFIPSVADTIGISNETAATSAALFSIVTLVFGVLFLFIAARIYKANQLIASDKNVTQVRQVSLFSRTVSELSMANIEDVTARQSGIFASIFNFGTLHIETAGEQNNFIFQYCPNPNAYAKAILDSRIDFITKHGD